MQDRHAARGIFPVLGGGRSRACADEQHQVRLHHDLARGLHAAVGAHHAGVERVRVRERPLAAHGAAYRRVQQGRERLERLAGARDDDAAAADDHRCARGDKLVGGALDVGGVRARAHGGEALVAILGPHVGVIDRLLLQIVGQADVRGTRPARGHRAKGASHRARDLLRAVDGRVPLGQRAVERLLVQLRQREFAARAHRDIGGDAEDGNRGFIGFHQARQQVGGAAAARAFAHAHAPRHARVRISHVSRAALVAGEDVVDAVVQPRKRVIERQARIAAQPEDVLHAVQLQHSHQRLGAVHCRRDPIAQLYTGPNPSTWMV